MIPEPDIALLLALIERLRTSLPMSWQEAELIRIRHSFDWSADDTGPVALMAHSSLYRARAFDILPPHGRFIGGAADQDLSWNVTFLGRLLDDWFVNAHSVPSHWADRICVLLRKAKRFDLERDFLSAFIPHYATPYTTTSNAPLIARAVKIGAID